MYCNTCHTHLTWLQLRFLTIQSKVSEITGGMTCYERDCLVREASGDDSRLKLVQPWEWFRDGAGNWASNLVLPVIVPVRIPDCIFTSNQL